MTRVPPARPSEGTGAFQRANRNASNGRGKQW